MSSSITPIEPTRVTPERESEIPDRGIDLGADRRPGVPMELEPHALVGAHWREPPRQTPDVRVLKRMELDRLTPVFGTAQPPSGLCGVIRRFAYRIPEHRARHWMLLLVADRVDVLEHRLGPAAKWLPIAVPLFALGLAAAKSTRPRRSRAR